MALVAGLGPLRSNVGLAMLPWTVATLSLLLLHRWEPRWLECTGWLLGVSVGLRLLFLLPFPDLSDDLFRYVWDGWLGHQGIPPYRFVPADPALATLQTSPLFPALNSPHYISVYPPLSQWVFRLGGAGHALWGWPHSALILRVSFTLLEVGGILLLDRTLQAMGVRRSHLILYAWNPLALLTVAGGGHTEGALVLGFGLLALGVVQRRPFLAWTGWGVAVLVKLLPLLLFPLLWRTLVRSVGVRRTGAGLLLTVPLGLWVSLPLLSPGDFARIWSSLDLYASTFEFNALRGLLPSPIAPGGAQLRALALLGALWIGLRRRAEGAHPFFSGVVLIFSLYLLTATTVHPWYLLWILPWLPLTERGRGGWLWGAWASLLTYGFYGGIPMAPLSALFWVGVLALGANEGREALFSRLRPAAGRRKAAWLAPWMRGPRLLDVGGGEGHVSLALKGGGMPPVTSVILVDPAAPEGDRPSGVHALEGDALRLPLPSGTADSVLLSFVLHHTSDPKEALREALRVARPGGRILILESVYETPLERRLLTALDRWVNAGRGLPRGPEGSDGGGPGRGWAEAPIQFQREEAWRALAESLGATVVHADRPNRLGHRVLRLILDAPGGPGPRALPLVSLPQPSCTR
jgi:alpha-1,6-mannosyltransferase